ncbi:hypothetical protein RI367_004453 [Sorochytrium milnesiophthora]
MSTLAAEERPAPQKQQSKACYIVDDEEWSRETTPEAQALRQAILDIAGRMVSLYFNIPDDATAAAAAGQDNNSSNMMSPTVPPFRTFVHNILLRTHLPLQTVTLSLLYICRIKQLNPGTVGAAGSQHRLVLAALMLAAKYLYDDSYNNKTWSSVSQGMFDLHHVNTMEREFLLFAQFRIFVSTKEWTTFTAFMETHLVPYIKAYQVNVPALSMDTFRNLVTKPMGSYLSNPLPSPMHKPRPKFMSAVGRQDSALGEDAFATAAAPAADPAASNWPATASTAQNPSRQRALDGAPRSRKSKPDMTIDIWRLNQGQLAAPGNSTALIDSASGLPTPVEEQQHPRQVGPTLPAQYLRWSKSQSTLPPHGPPTPYQHPHRQSYQPGAPYAFSHPAN